MVKLTAAEFTEKWGRNLKGSTPDITRGIERVTEAPGIMAAKKVDKMRAKVLEKIDDGTWAKRVAAVPLSEWKEKMIKKGVGRISAGVDGAKNKMTDFAGALLPVIEASQADIAKMPDVTLDDSRARMNKHFDNMSKFKYK